MAEPKYLMTAASLYWARIQSRLQTGPMWRFRFVGPAPDRVLFSPSCLRPGDPLVARDIYQGRFTFSGHTVDAGAKSVFKAPPPSRAWQESLHQFLWLRHLEKADTELAAENARALLDDWFVEHGKGVSGHAWEPAICADRLIAWLQHARFVLQNSEHGFYRRYMAFIARHVRYLRSCAAGLDDSIILLKVRIALAFASMALPTAKSAQKKSAARLEAALKTQILHDGGHVSRNPDVLPEILATLLPLSQLYVAASHTPPPELLRSIDRMFPMVRFFRHADGSMAQFHGSGNAPAALAAAVLRNDNTNGAVAGQAVQSGYNRLSEGDAVVVADTGKPVGGVNGEHNHASALAFEFSAQRSRLVINIGVDRAQRPAYDTVRRATAAHSTLSFDDQSSAAFYDFSIAGSSQVRLVRGPTLVETQPWSDDNATGFSSRHNGYVKTDNVWHERGLQLSKDGLKLTGYDRLTPDSIAEPDEKIADLRFHLHPSVLAEEEDENRILLTTDKGARWRFVANGALPKIEQSIFLGGVSGPVFTSQIAISIVYPRTDTVRWRFECIASSS